MKQVDWSRWKCDAFRMWIYVNTVHWGRYARYGDSVDDTVEENSIVFFLIRLG